MDPRCFYMLKNDKQNMEEYYVNSNFLGKSSVYELKVSCYNWWDNNDSDKNSKRSYMSRLYSASLVP